jgi:hypothetical protein
VTCDGKVMSVTQKEICALALACGYSDMPPMIDDEDFDWRSVCSEVGAVWLAMTQSTEYRWRTGREDMPSTGKYADEINAENLAACDRWYA